jgi:ABC-2 type transport system permease protein
MNAGFSHMSQSRVIAAYLGDIRFELVKMLRTPAFALPTLLFPVMFYVLFGVIMGAQRGNGAFALYALAGYGVFGTMAPGLFGFGVSLAFEREMGTLTYRQALPMPSGSYLLARMATAMVFVGISTLMLIILAATAGHVPITFGQALHLLTLNIFGVLPFCAIGMFVGAMVSGQAAPAVINMIYLPMAFLSGVWFPVAGMSKVLHQLSPLWPSYHLVQLDLGAVGAPTLGSTANHVAALTGVTVLFYFLAMRRLSNRGFQLLGPARSGGRAVPLRRAASMGVMGLAIGLVLTGVLGGNAPQAKADTAATSKDATEGNTATAATDAAAPSGPPVGVAAPDTVVLADFDNGSEKTSYGLGFASRDDKDRGGDSTISQKLVEGGARNSRGALEVTGTVGTAIPYAFVGTSFIPNPAEVTEWDKMGTMDYSNKKTLSFFARGDGHTYTVMILNPVIQGIPPMYGFVAGPEWTEVRVPLHNLAGLDLQRVKLISIGANTPGPFSFAIDDVRIE